MKVSELLAKATPQPVTRAKNLGTIAWVDGYLLVKFRGRSTLYIFGPKIPECEFDKIMANPFPDKLFSTNIRAKYRSFKVPE